MKKWFMVILIAIFIFIYLCSGKLTWLQLLVLPLLVFLVILILGSWVIAFLGQIIRGVGPKSKREHDDPFGGRGEHIPHNKPEETLNRQKEDSV